MANFPPEILTIISKYLKLSDLVSFLRTHYAAKELVAPWQIDEMKLWGPILKEYDKIFRDYAWVKRVEYLGLTPILVYRNKEKSYIDLWLADKKQEMIQGRNFIVREFGKGRFRTDQEKHVEKRKIFDIILRSLRTRRTGEREYLIQFPNFTLDLSGVLSCPTAIPTWDFSWLNRRFCTMTAVVYGGGVLEVQYSFSSCARWIHLCVPGFEDVEYYAAVKDMVRMDRPAVNYGPNLAQPLVTKGWKRADPPGRAPHWIFVAEEERGQQAIKKRGSESVTRGLIKRLRLTKSGLSPN